MNIEKLIKVVKLTKHARVGDSDKLKQMAYKFAQMGNYFDRANSANSRRILAKEDDQKYAEFYNYGLQVLAQLKQEVESMKRNDISSKPYTRSFDNDTLNLLRDAASRLYWIANDMRDRKGDALSKKIQDLIKEYKNTAYDSIKAKDGWINTRGTTRQGYEVRAIYNGKSGRLYAVIYRPKTNDFLVAAGYNQQRGDWDQGYYDYKSEEEARKFAEKHAKQMYDSMKDALYTYEFPKFTAEDRSQARRYGLEIIRETSQDTIVRGDLKKIKEFADNYLGYQLNKDYLSKDSVKDEVSNSDISNAAQKIINSDESKSILTIGDKKIEFSKNKNKKSITLKIDGKTTEFSNKDERLQSRIESKIKEAIQNSEQTTFNTK